MVTISDTDFAQLKQALTDFRDAVDFNRFPLRDQSPGSERINHPAALPPYLRDLYNLAHLKSSNTASRVDDTHDLPRRPEGARTTQSQSTVMHEDIMHPEDRYVNEPHVFDPEKINSLSEPEKLTSLEDTSSYPKRPTSQPDA